MRRAMTRLLTLTLAFALAGAAVASDAEAGTASAATSASFATTTGFDPLHPSKILAQAASVSDYVVGIRRELHRNPELMWTETET